MSSRKLNILNANACWNALRTLAVFRVTKSHIPSNPLFGPALIICARIVSNFPDLGQMYILQLREGAVAKRRCLREFVVGFRLAPRVFLCVFRYSSLHNTRPNWNYPKLFLNGPSRASHNFVIVCIPEFDYYILFGHVKAKKITLKLSKMKGHNFRNTIILLNLSSPHVSRNNFNMKTILKWEWQSDVYYLFTLS